MVKYAAGLSGALEPSLVRQVGAALNDDTEKRTQRSARSVAPGNAFERYLSYVGEGLEVPGHYPKAWTDSDGKPIKREQFDNQVGTFLWRLLSPMRMGKQVPEKKTEPH